MHRMGMIGVAGGVVVGLVVLAVVRWGAGAGAGREPGPLRVVASIAPLAGLAGELAGAGAEVRSLIPAGASPHGAELSPSEVSALGRADVVVLVGYGFEPGIERALAAWSREGQVVWRFSEALGDGGEHDHDHGQAGHGHDSHGHGSPGEAPGGAVPQVGEGGHDHGADPHVWLDPVLVAEGLASLAEAVKAGARRVAAGEGGEGGSAAAGVNRRLIELRERVSETHRGIVEVLRPYEGRAIVAHHSSFDRFAGRYGLRVAAVIRPNDAVEPTSGDLSRALEGVRGGAGVVLVEPQFEGVEARRVASEGGAVVVEVDPIGTGDWFELVEGNARAIAAGLAEASGDGG